jgi:predicted MPP superfamily phosphohydrolase
MTSAISRRRFLASAAGLAAAGIGGDMFVAEPRRVLVSRHDVALPALPKELDGIRIAQVSDVHLPANRAAAERAAALIAAERPEIVVLSGDQCETAKGIAELVAFVSAVRGMAATLAVLGNWDYRGGTVGDVAREAYAKAGATLLINEYATVRVGGAQLAFAGLDDVLAGGPDLQAAAAGLPAGVPVIGVVHEPGFTDQAPPAGVPAPALTLSGHTHGGQIRIPGLPAHTPIGSGRFVAGWYQAGWSRLYVSRGIGTADIRARLFCPPELPIFTLRRA